MQIGITGVLTVLFVLLKVTGYITWSWLWVFSPLWLSLIVALVFFLVWLLIVSKHAG